jgi:hypothetical protein
MHYFSVSLHEEGVVNIYLDLSIDGQTTRYMDATSYHPTAGSDDWEIRYKSAEIGTDPASGSLVWTVNPWRSKSFSLQSLCADRRERGSIRGSFCI